MMIIKKNSIITKLIFIFLCLGTAFNCIAQDELEPYFYDFVQYNNNQIELPKNSSFDHFFAKMDSLINYKENQLHVLHLGDSHIQADLFSHQVRLRMQQNEHLGNAGRGFLFPYQLAKTNNPYNYTVKYRGSWTGCRNASNKDKCDWGVAGITAKSHTTNASFTINLNPESNVVTDRYTSSTIDVYFTAKDSLNYDLGLRIDDSLHMGIKNLEKGIISFQLDSAYLMPYEFEIVKTEDYQQHFIIQGILFKNNEPGILYSSLGVNGAKYESFLRCDLLSQQLESLQPDLIIISLGTNDAYNYGFNETEFYSQVSQLITRIRSTCPNVSILLTSPGDSFRKRVQTNPNNEKAAKTLFQVAVNEGCGYWDFYTIMGGIKSMNAWKTHGLGKSDFLHLSGKGYVLQGEMLYEALVNDLYFSQHYQLLQH